jgi:signal transduction histidine kinase
MFRSTSMRLAALYTGVFALSVVVLALVIFSTLRQAVAEQFDTRIRAESMALVREYQLEGLDGVVQAVRERDRTPGSLDYGLTMPDGTPVAGRLASARAPLGWSMVRATQEPEGMRVLAVDLPNGFRLLVGDDEDPVEDLEAAVLQRFGWALAGVVVLGAAGGFALSREVGRRLAAISDTAEAIIEGDLSRRIDVRGSGDDLDRVATTINRMLDRIEMLMESLRQVSSDIAHDMRTPLTRLRNRLEAGLAHPEEHRETLEGGLADLDAILDTFAALLRIAQIDGGARRAGFRDCDVTEVARTVVEAFGPSAEETQQVLTLAEEGPAWVHGDAELLTQMLVNLVENGLRHAGRGARIEVRCGPGAEGPELSVTDDGPGVPAEERQRLFERFYRLEHSRSTPGSGLGLALVAAVARLHGAEAQLDDARPGLIARVRFPPPGQARMLGKTNLAVTPKSKRLG